MLVSSFNLSQSFNYAPYLFCKKRLKSEINCFCIRTQSALFITGKKNMKYFIDCFVMHCGPFMHHTCMDEFIDYVHSGHATAW
jgi:hypothetical protein